MSAQATIALNRFGLGARPGDRVGSDPRGWLLAQLSRFDAAPAAIAELPGRANVAQELRDYRRMQADRRKARRQGQDPEDLPVGGDRGVLHQTFVQSANARIAAAVASETPFVERLVHFWSNHFAISADKLEMRPLAGNYEFAAIRPHVLGDFADLLTAAVTHPAMMIYLDQAVSIGPKSAFATRRSNGSGNARGLNENLAREILELHTLGVRTGYSQADVTEFARALTGWSVSGLGIGPSFGSGWGDAGTALFAPALHEPGARTVMGKRYPEGGREQAEAILRDLVANPATGRHIATKLARHFIADEPPAAAVDRLAKAFTGSNGHLPTVYRAVVESPEAWSTTAAKFRTPWDWSIASLRATGLEHRPRPKQAWTMLTQLGQPIWRPGSPAGWGDTASDWIGPGALMSRVEMAQSLAATVGDALDARELGAEAFPGTLGQETATGIARAEQPATGLALLLASPEFMRR